MATNPIPIIIPCHRVIASNGKLQGFGGTIGLPLKTKTPPTRSNPIGAIGEPPERCSKHRIRPQTCPTPPQNNALTQKPPLTNSAHPSHNLFLQPKTVTDYEHIPSPAQRERTRVRVTGAKGRGQKDSPQQNPKKPNSKPNKRKAAMPPLQSFPIIHIKVPHGATPDENHRRQKLPGMDRPPKPDACQNRDRRRHLWMGRIRLLQPRTRRQRNGRPLSRVPSRTEPHAARAASGRRCIEANTSKADAQSPVQSPPSTSHSTTSSARNSASPSTNSSAASSETGSPPSHPAEAPPPKKSPRWARPSGPTASKPCASTYRPSASKTTPELFEPRESIAPTAEALIKAREALGLEPVIGIDYHHRLSVAEAASFCQMMPTHTLDFIEEPIRDESPEAYEELRKLTVVPFAHRRRVRIQMAVPPLHREGTDELRPTRHLQRRRIHRSHESRRMGRSTLHRPHAPQPSRPNLRCRNNPTSPLQSPTSLGSRLDTPSANRT